MKGYLPQFTGGGRAAPEKPTQLRNDGRFVLALLVGNLLVAILLGTVYVQSQLAARESALDRARSNAERLATSLQLSIESEIEQADIVLRNVAAQVRAAGGVGTFQPETLALKLQAQRALVGHIDSLRLTDAQGVVTHGAEGLGGTGTSLGDRDYFRSARGLHSDTLVISEPVMGRIDNKWVIALARRLDGADGSFQGIVHANIAVDHFAALLGSVRLEAGDAVTLRMSSMALVARHARDDSLLTMTGSRQVSSQLVNALQHDPRQGSYLAVAALDGVERCNAYRQVGHYPLVLVVGLNTASVLGPWKRQALESGALVSLVVLTACAASWIAYRAWRRQRSQALAVERLNHRHEALLRTASDGMHVINRDGYVVELSDSFAEMLGELPHEMTGRHITSWDATYSPTQIATWLTNFGHSERARVETRYRRRDGTEIDVEIMFAGILVDGQALIYCSARDVTLRKQLEAELASAAAQTRDLYDQAPCGYHSLDADGRIVQVNATELKWLGATREEVVGRMRITDFFTDEGRLQFHSYFPRLKVEGAVDGLEFDLIPLQGESRRVSLSATVVRGDSGEFVRSRTVMYDISELKRVQNQLRELANTQQIMLDNDLIGMVKLHDRTIVWKNQAMDRIFGYQGIELLGQSTRMLFVDDESFASEGAAAYSTLEGGRRYRQQLRMRRKDGSEFWVDANGARLSSNTRESLWMLADISALKNAQAVAERLAFHDALTGLPNRLLLVDRLQQAIAQAQRQGLPLAVCYLDLDGFKAVNDRLGHAAGDDLLKEVARRIQGAVRTNDTVCRLGGDEFVILMTQVANEDDCRNVLLRLAQAVALPVELSPATQASVTASIGVAMFPRDGEEAGLLIERADQSMYLAKRAGKATLRFFAIRSEAEGREVSS